MRILIETYQGNVTSYAASESNEGELDITIYDTYTTELQCGSFDYDPESDTISNEAFDDELKQIQNLRYPR